LAIHVRVYGSDGEVLVTGIVLAEFYIILISRDLLQFPHGKFPV
jgi:hypothetical protein